MYFDETYFKGEEREGFYIKPMMKRAWAAQLEILLQIDAICQRHNIQYYASSGTLLGAIRHGGYIPWDDDLDIEMKRLDYELFLKIAGKELPPGYKISNPATDSTWKAPFSKVSNSTKVPLQNEQLQQFHGFPWQAGVDIFPIDYLPVNKSEEDMMLDLFCAVAMLASDWDKGKLSDEEKEKNLGEVETLCNIKFTKDKPYMQQLWMLADRIGAMYWDTETEAKETTMFYMLAKRSDFRFPSSCYKQSKRVPFENITIPIPVGYEQILTVLYGEDYMTPKQGVADHEYPFYKVQQELFLKLNKDCGFEITSYLLE